MDIVMAVAAWCSIIGFIFDSAERRQSRKKQAEKKIVPQEMKKAGRKTGPT